MALAFEAPGLPRPDAIYTAQIYAIALGGGMSSRLFQEMREKRGCATRSSRRPGPMPTPAC
jgi:predicted Zn-dependent peptidase